MEVDVDKSLELMHQENGRIKPADRKEYARAAVKKFVCPICNHDVEVSKLSFGETVLCPTCKEPMIQQ